ASGDWHWVVLKVKNTSTETEWILDPGRFFAGKFGPLRRADIYILSGNDVALSPFTGHSARIHLPQNREVTRVLPAGGLPRCPAAFAPDLVKMPAYVPQGGLGAELFLPVFFIGLAFVYFSVAFTRSQYNYLAFVLYFTLMALCAMWDARLAMQPL